jgi:acyl-coenzyme A synthetase/AMP-(fatty) acid ligase
MLPKHMLPSFIVVTDEFPKTATHKIQKNLVAAAFDRNTAWHSPAAERDI